MTPETALAVYGTLRPNEPIDYVVKDIGGEWAEGFVRGYVYEITWGPAEGYPGLTLASDGHFVPVSILVSADMVDHLWKVDRFEGPGYERRDVTVFGHSVDDEPPYLELGGASIYEALTQVD